MAPATSSALPIASISSELNFVGSAQPVAVTVVLESSALNRYAALVFGLPLAALFALAALVGSVQITPVQVPFALLVVAASLLIVTALCRSVAQRFEAQLQLEIRH